MNLNQQSALVLFSGGQDSATCLAWALEKFSCVETVGFDYRQRHAIELQCRGTVREAILAAFPEWAAALGEDHLVDLSVLGLLSETALTRNVEIQITANNLPSTFVPGRNLLFMTAAACIAYRRGIKHIVGGMCETDFSGYPDCRDDTIKSLQATLNLGMDTRFVLHTPLMWIDKAQTWDLAASIGGKPLVDLIIEHTHTCYLGDRSHRHVWGWGCGACPACEIRAKGFDRFTTADLGLRRDL
ncbi:7-cyano-7-deazaguanine synthase QueC [Bradyrhizobium cosmicum]|uniref:7-cyano-7-deazaguanine synthase n=1 Tax=Bradyrhizobium cosmicum TaxID=1404864 RepID=A0AAI8Q9Z3_9BRAD|nr:7-cyano-7-deazaguanine synthase QueC [Bradyrhizobium cosmicum]BAL73765.1 hypothetical protein S23_05440 [Bradyrhizobium cosmicum]